MRGYFDTNATAPMTSAVAQVLHEAEATLWHNPSALYPAAALARQRIESAREMFAAMLGADPTRLAFFSGATEANNAVFHHHSQLEGSVLIGNTEHPCVRDAAVKWFGRSRVKEIDPCLEAIKTALESSDVALVSIMAANNETGIEHDWRAIAELCKKEGVPYHCDAAQWVGKRDSSALEECDYVTVSGHKFGAARGIGALILPSGETSFRWLAGGSQESGRRGGTENLAAALTLPIALESAGEGDSAPRDAFEAAVDARVLGAEASRLWNTSMLLMPHTRNVKWLVRLAAKGFALSTGSACSAGAANPSHVMEAMGLDYDEMGRVLRVSSGWHTSAKDWQALATAFNEVAAEIQQRPPKQNFLTP